ncbi:outer membrane lipoprotein-sorting protein [Hypnocyclicus thermotrophus]|uniref:Outer membrane lipoprotein-sorting protein n=1 Tax=Hypnocyclicus thermotrophus TaxID=1627895 RepID=A0AA46I5V7_9FUSO|nr:outer membrane lipoprotein-sorting protein [Hypnocyclicus thermotrophus]TDT71757.1 outer membrane lipoprotein-sorting protein [Hypnocyclicus thermotrophus]
MKKILVGLLIVVMSLSAFSMTGKEIMQAVKDRDTGKTLHALMGMDLIDKDGTVNPRTIEVWGETYDEANDLSRSIMVFKAPASVKNTRFLQVENKDRDDDKWIYLPALKRVRRISSSEGSSSFMGSDFTYDDMETRDVEEDNHKLLREEKLGNYDCYVIESKAKNSEDSQYDKVISWVSKEHFIVVKAELYSKKTKKIEKILTVKQDLAQVNGIWTIFETIMENVETGHKTKLYIKRSKSGSPYIEYNKAINPARFTQKYLKTGR